MDTEREYRGTAKETILLPDRETIVRSLMDNGLLNVSESRNHFYHKLATDLADQTLTAEAIVNNWVFSALEAFPEKQRDPQHQGAIDSEFDTFVGSVISSSTVAEEVKRQKQEMDADLQKLAKSSK